MKPNFSQITQTNFSGLSDFIKDPEILEHYMSVFEIALKEVYNMGMETNTTTIQFDRQLTPKEFELIKDFCKGRGIHLTVK